MTHVHARNALRAADLQQPPDVARLAHRRAEPHVDDADGRVRAREQRRAERHDVGAVVLARVPRDRLVGAHRRADAAHLVGRDRRADAGAVDDDAGVRLAARHRARHRGRRCPDSRPVGRVGARRRSPPAPARRCWTSARFIAIPVWSLPIATRRMSAVGARSAGSAVSADPAGTTVTRRAASVSLASGVTWPPAAAPPSRRRRASARPPR